MDSKMDDSDSEYETEEAVVLVELNGIIDSNFLHEEQNPCKILGIETGEPILQLGHYIFSGEYEDTMGTVVVYEPVQVERNDGQVDTDFKFLCKTDKKLSMKRVFLQEKKSLRTNEPTPVELTNAPLESSMIAAEHCQKLTSLKHPDNMTQAIKENFGPLQNIRSVCVQSSECSVEPQNFNGTDLDAGAISEIASKNEQMLEKQSVQENSESDCNITALVTEMVDTVSSNDNLKKVEDENFDMNCSKVELAENDIVIETESSELVKNVSSEKEKYKAKKGKKRKYTEIDSDDVKKTVQMLMEKVTSSENVNPIDKRTKKVSKATFSSKNDEKYSSEKIKGTDIPNKSDASVFQEEKLPSKFGVVSSNDSASCVSFQESTNLDNYNSIDKPRSSKKLSHETVNLINQISSNSDDGGNSLNIIEEQVNQQLVLNTDTEDNVNQLVQSSTDKVVERMPCVNNGGILEERYEKCTSSADMKYSIDSLNVLNPCQSSELKHENEKKNASSSFSKKGKNHNTNQAVTGKVILCEVSQSVTDYSSDGKDLQECETHEQSHSSLESCDSISHTLADPCASSTESEVSDKSKILGENKTENANVARVSSCEVTQSNNSEKMSPKNTESTNECEASVKDCSLDNGAENFYPYTKELRMQDAKFGGSLVEVSQSDKECETQKFKGSIKGIKESLQRGMVCSQSSDSPCTFSRQANVDSCVSSCDIKKHSLNEEEITASSSENETLSISCEVTQSDKIENENKREFNECSQSVNSVASASNNIASETEYFHANISSHSKIIASTKGSASKDTSCEVSQSFKSDSFDSSPLKQDNLKLAGNSSECEVFVKSDHSESSDVRTNSADNSYISSGRKFSDSLCVNANNMRNPCEVSQSSSCENDLASKSGKSSDDKINTNECEVIQSNSFKRSVDDSSMSSGGKKILKRPICEVSQSIASKERIKKGESSRVLGLKARGKASGELGNNCEVSQSLSSEQRIFETNDNNITASKMDIASTSHLSNEYEKEMECESSDDISDDIWNVKHKNKDLTGEISQSDRSQFRDNSLPHSSKLISTDVGDSSECEVYGQRSLHASSAQNSTLVKSCVKEICGSSEDVESFRSTHTSSNLKSECKSSTNEISQSIKYDKNKINAFSLDKENSTNECDMSGQDGSNITSEVAGDICESSEDVHASKPVVSFLDECTSSIRDSRVLTNESEHLFKVCDSLSNAETTLLTNEIENCNISQSGNQTLNDDVASAAENNLSLDSSNVALDSVNVSSSVDSLSSSYIDSIYSSSVLLNSSQNYTSVSSLNSEVTQSCTKDSSQKQKENTEALNEENSSACLIVSETNDEVSQEIEFNGVQSSNDLELTHLTLLNDRVNVLESSSALNEYKTLSINEPGTSSSTAHSFQDDFSGLELVESSTATYPLAQKKETKLAENSNAITEGQDVKDVHRHIEVSRCTSNASSENDNQKQKLNILGISESESSGQLTLRDNLHHSDVDQLSEQCPVPSKMVSSSRAEKQLSGSRPSLLEVIVSSASDFRNSLIHEGNNFVRIKSQHSSPGQAVESSSNNVEACQDGYSESFNEAIGYSNELDNQDNERSFEAGTDLSKDQVNEYPDSEVSGSYEQIHSDSILDEQNNSQHQVSQSSEIVNTHSSTSKVHSLPSDITESSQRDFVQSSTSISSVSRCVTLKDSSLNSEQVSSAEESILTSNLDISEVCESSSAQDVLMSDSRNTPVASNSENLGNVTESSTGMLKYPTNYKTISQAENTESEVSSSPCDAHYSALVDGSGQCSVVEGNIVIQGKLCRESNRPNDLSDNAAASVDNLEASCSNITSNSNALQCLPCGSSYVKEIEISELHEDRSSFNVIGSSNEAKGLIQGTSSSSVIELDQSENRIRLHSQNEEDFSSSDVIFEANVANSPINEVEIVADVYECDESSASCEMENNSSLCEVTESHAVTMDDLLESSPGENKVSCSVSEISLNNQTFYKNYGFNENEFCQLSSHEAVAKSPDNCESSYEVNICDNVLAVQSISHSASENEELSMYSHGADFENDSVQSSSFEAPFSVSEQIKVISSPTFTDTNCFEVQAPLTSNSFMTLPSETQFLTPDQCDISLNKFTSSSSSSMCTSEVTQSSPENSVIVSNYSTYKDRQSSPSTSSSHNIIPETNSSQLGVLETEDNLYVDNNCTSNNSSHLRTNENEDYWSQEAHFDCTEEIVSESHSDVDNLADSTEDGTDMASDSNAKL